MQQYKTLQSNLKALDRALEKIKAQQSLIDELTIQNNNLQRELKTVAQGCRTLYHYIEEIHRVLANNFHRTPIEEIFYREISLYLKKQPS